MSISILPALIVPEMNVTHLVLKSNKRLPFISEAGNRKVWYVIKLLEVLPLHVELSPYYTKDLTGPGVGKLNRDSSIQTSLQGRFTTYSFLPP